MESFYLLVLLYINLLGVCLCFVDPVTLFSVAVFAGTSYVSLNYFKCSFDECCSKPYIDFKVSTLEEDLKKILFGQHLAEKIVLKTLQGYLRNPNPKKALVMSFHGPTGSGKNFVASKIAKSLYRLGANSNFVHQYIANKDFPHVSEVSKYQDLLRNDIQKYSKECYRNLFIFDEVDKMPPGTLDALKPFIDYYEVIEGVDYRKNIFIFLSNAGSKDIIETSLHFWKEGRNREDITMKHIEPSVNKGAFNERGGFQFSELLSSALIDVYVPFLPLEKSHVRECIKAELDNNFPNRRDKDSIIKEVEEELIYFPEGTDLYSASGCKRIKNKIDAIVV